jgi:hypothetical protein
MYHRKTRVRAHMAATQPVEQRVSGSAAKSESTQPRGCCSFLLHKGVSPHNKGGVKAWVLVPGGVRPSHNLKDGTGWWARIAVWDALLRTPPPDASQPEHVLHLIKRCSSLPVVQRRPCSPEELEGLLRICNENGYNAIHLGPERNWGSFTQAHSRPDCVIWTTGMMMKPTEPNLKTCLY